MQNHLATNGTLKLCGDEVCPIDGFLIVLFASAITHGSEYHVCSWCYMKSLKISPAIYASNQIANTPSLIRKSDLVTCALEDCFFSIKEPAKKPPYPAITAQTKYTSPKALNTLWGEIHNVQFHYIQSYKANRPGWRFIETAWLFCDPEYSKVVITKPVQEEGNHRGKFWRGFKREGGRSRWKKIIKIEREWIRLKESYLMANPNSGNFCYIRNNYTNNTDNYNGKF